MTVFLVGAGPGDPGLMTVRSRELIAAADVILYDRLIPPGALAGAREDAELVYVGKVGGGPQMPQEEIDRLLVSYGTRMVVRLKGGDPFVFGRGGEEALRLREAGIPFEVVPGVTAGIAAPAYAGIPVTHREIASGVAFVTGHEDGTLEWDALAAFPGTLVFYMGVKALPRIAERLMAGGRPASQPVAVVERGTLPGQRTVLATLADVAERAAGVRAPAITLVGDVAALREQIAWLESRPLYGRTVAVTRARAQASALAVRLRDLGAEVVEAPAIRTRPLEASLPSGFDLLCVTSPVGAERLFDLLRDARDLAGVTVAAIGPGTARVLQARGIEPDVVPERAVAEGLVEALADVPVRHAVIARAAEGRDVLPDALRERGARVDVVALYETVAEPLDDDTRAAAASADYVLFTSASSVRFFAAAGGSLSGPKLVSIGPATSAELREHGAEPDLEADPHTPDGLVAALIADAWPITFLSDYGPGDEYVGVVVGVIATIAPDARVIDLGHGVPPQDVRTGSRRLARALPFTPPGVHLAVVDPGVGTSRRAIAIETGDRILVGPDNGLLIPAAGTIDRAVEISDSPWRLEPVSATFHGRDIFGPVTAHLANGEPLSGTEIDPATLVRLPDLRPRPGIVHVVEVDGFGNLITDGALPEGPVSIDGLAVTVGRTFGDVPAGELVLYVDSAGDVALAVNGGSAAERLGVRTGDELRLEPA